MGCCQQIKGYGGSKGDTVKVKTATPRRLKRDTFVTKKCSSRIKDFEFLEKLGSGAFGTVFKARDKVTGQLRAIKSLKKSQMHLEHIHQEIEILKDLDHPNIVQIFEFIEERDIFFIVMELCTGETLFRKVTHFPKFSEKDCAKYLSQILSVTVHCHERGIIHRDIKPENIVFESEAENSLIKVIDFGLSNRIVKDDKLTDLSGTPYFIAPEVIQRRYDEKADMWSIGIVMYILLSGKVPFRGMTTELLFNNITNTPVAFHPDDWVGISNKAIDFLKLLLKKNPKQRISAAEALAHPWIRSKVTKNVNIKSININVLNRLQMFQIQERLRQTVLIYIASHLSTNTDLQVLREAFVQLDDNSDGKISKPELLEAYKLLNLGGELEVTEIMKRCDIDQDGFIDHSEFITAATDWEKELSKKNLIATFKELDVNKSGTLTSEDFAVLIGKDVEDKYFIREMMKEADVNMDGKIDLEEFLNFIQGN